MLEFIGKDERIIMSNEEKAASERLKYWIRERKITCFDYLKYLSNYSVKELEQSGYRNKTNAEAMKIQLDSVNNEIEKMIKKHEKDYLD